MSDPGDGDDLFGMLADRFDELGGADLELPPRSTPARGAELSELRGQHGATKE